MPRALILSYHFYPSREVGARRVSELARRLRDAGWTVTAIAAPGPVVPELAARITGIKVISVEPPPKLYPRIARWLRRGRGGTRTGGEEAGAPPRATGGSWRAVLWRNCNALEWTLDDRKLWAWRVAWRALRLGRGWDWVISSGPPVSVHVAARMVAGLTGARWLMDLRDPWVGNRVWPEHVRSTLRDRLEQAIEGWCVRRADWITVASPGIGAALAARRPKAAPRLQVVLNGYDGVLAPGAAATGQLRLLYAGNLYFNRDPFPLLEAVRVLVEEPGVDRRQVGFTLVGDCRSWNGRDLSAWIRAVGLDDCVRVLAPVAPAAVREMMRSSEVLVNFAQGQPDQIPAKLYDYLASGRETLLIAESASDAARITRESGCGRVVEPADRAGLHRALRDLYDFYVERKRSYRRDRDAVADYSRFRQNSRFLALLTGTPAGS